MNLLTGWFPSSLFCFITITDVMTGATDGTATHTSTYIILLAKEEDFSLEENTGFILNS